MYVAGVAELVSGALSMGVGGYLSAQAERDHYRYLRKTTRERVLRSCAGEMEREVNAILSPLGVDDSISRRVAGALLKVEAQLPPPQPHPSMWRQCLEAVARRPKFSKARDDERTSLLRGAASGDRERGAVEGDDDEDEDEKGMTAFLLKFGEGLEETTDARLFISAITIGLACECRQKATIVDEILMANRCDRYSASSRFHWWSGSTHALLLYLERPQRLVYFLRSDSCRVARVWRVQDILHRCRDWSVSDRRACPTRG